MKRTVTVRARAELDLKHACDWYALQRAGLDAEFLTEVREAIFSAASHPERASIYYRQFRRIRLDRFPYKLFYKIRGNEVIVFRVLHSSQDHRQKL